MYYERKQDKRKYKHVVDNNLKYKGRAIYGATDDLKRVVKVNKRLSKTKPTHKRRYPEVLDTETHELQHEKHPNMTEKDVYKKTRKLVRRMTKKQRQKVYSKFHAH